MPGAYRCTTWTCGFWLGGQLTRKAGSGPHNADHSYDVTLSYGMIPILPHCSPPHPTSTRPLTSSRRATHSPAARTDKWYGMSVVCDCYACCAGILDHSWTQHLHACY